MRTHGMKPKSGAALEYTAWSNMRARCRNPKNRSYCYYGGRGIKVKFANFEEFFAHLGKCPEGMTLDRIDNNGHYEKGNVRWATKDQQMANKSDNRRLTHRGKTQTLAQWGKELGISLATLWARLENSRWSIEKTLTTPLNTAKAVGRLGAKARWK